MNRQQNEQFLKLIERHPESLILFRIGDFYEAYYEDAIKVSEILGVLLTKMNDDHSELCAFPYYDLDTYLPRLIKAGCKVAICDRIKE